MKYALYDVESKMVQQWQDTDVFSYTEPMAAQARLALESSTLPAAFDPHAWPAGWWVIDGALTQTAPPPSLPQIAQALQWAVSGRRFKDSAGVALPDASIFAPSDADLFTRIMPIVLGHPLFGITEIDIQMGGAWRTFSVVELEDACAALMQRREALFSAERAHLEAIATLLDAEDRQGLEAYDVSTGWPAPEAP